MRVSIRYLWYSDQSVKHAYAYICVHIYVLVKYLLSHKHKHTHTSRQPSPPPSSPTPPQCHPSPAPHTHCTTNPTPSSPSSPTVPHTRNTSVWYPTTPFPSRCTPTLFSLHSPARWTRAHCLTVPIHIDTWCGGVFTMYIDIRCVGVLMCGALAWVCKCD